MYTDTSESSAGSLVMNVHVRLHIHKAKQKDIVYTAMTWYSMA